MECDAANVRLNGYKGFWGFGGVAGPRKLELLKMSCQAAEHYFCVGIDLLDCGAARLLHRYTELMSLLRFHYFAMQTTQATAAAGPAAIVDNQHQTDWLELLGEWLILLRAVLELLGDTLVPFPAPPGKPTWIQVPNGQVLELLVYCKYLAQPDLQKPRYLQDLKQLLGNGSTLQQFSAMSNDPPHLQTGLPVVLFVCMGHQTPVGEPHIVVACSADNWPGNTNLHRASRQWRQARMTDIAEKDNLRSMGGRIGERFRTVKRHIVSVAPHDSDGFQGRMDTNGLSNAEFNELITAMYNNTPPYGPDPHTLGSPYGNNHLSEPGRSFWGSGQNIYWEMSRCWKCRFMTHYKDEYTHPGAHADPLRREHPTQTAFEANDALNCAEDLCHLFCLNTAHLIVPTPDWSPPYPAQPYLLP